MAKTFTRAEFYDLVWSKPITQLAKDFRLSDVAIHKICRKHAVPTPPPGWWAKKHAGHSVERTPLPDSNKGTRSTIAISTPEICAEPDVLSEAREKARFIASSAKTSGKLVKDPIVEATIEALRNATPSHKGLVSTSASSMISCEVAPASVKRLEKVLRRLVAAAEHQGFELLLGSNRPVFAGGGQTFSFSVKETFKREKHTATAKEKAAVAGWERRSRQHDWRYRSEDPYPRIPDWDYVLTGQLGIEFSGVYISGERSPRSTWRDGKTQKLEEISAEIAVGLVVLAAAKTEAKRLQDEAEELRWQARLKREMPFRLQYIEERRSFGLDEILGDIIKLAHFRQLIGQLRSTYAADGEQPRVAEFLKWSESELERREAALLPKGLERRFEERRLFGDRDDHDFVARNL